MKLKSARIGCNTEGCDATRQAHPVVGTDSSLRASLAKLRLKLRSVGWVCDDDTNTDLCPEHRHHATNQETA